jgi:hypothetical protein
MLVECQTGRLQAMKLDFPSVDWMLALKLMTSVTWVGFETQWKLDELRPYESSDLWLGKSQLCKWEFIPEAKCEKYEVVKNRCFQLHNIGEMRGFGKTSSPPNCTSLGDHENAFGNR